MANFEEDDPNARAVLPSLLALRKALYSTEFRQFVTAVTGCAPSPFPPNTTQRERRRLNDGRISGCSPSVSSSRAP
jgi:hypothetical protein